MSVGCCVVCHVIMRLFGCVVVYRVVWRVVCCVGDHIDPIVVWRVVRRVVWRVDGLECRLLRHYTCFLMCSVPCRLACRLCVGDHIDSHVVWRVVWCFGNGFCRFSVGIVSV